MGVAVAPDFEPSSPFPENSILKPVDPFRAAVEHTPTPILITDPRLPDNPVVFVNRAFLQLTGYEAEEVMGRNCRFLQGEGTSARDVGAIRAALAAESPIEIDILNYKKSGTAFWNRLHISPVKTPDGVLQHFVGTQLDVTQELKRFAELQKERDTLSMATERHKDQLNYIADVAKIGFWVRDQRSGTINFSAECRRIFGLTDDEPVHFDQIMDQIALEDRMAVIQQTQKAFASGGAYSMEYRVISKTGQTVWVETRAKALLGKEPTLMGVMLDITDRKKAEADKALVVREIAHRFKNSMAMVQSIANQTLRNARDPAEAGRLFNERLRALAQAHDMLLQDDWGGATIQQIADTALAPFNSTFGHRIRMTGPSLFVSDRVTVSLSLGLFELATNAVKYGALANDRGIIEFDWKIVEDHGEKKFQMRWVETGGPEVSRPSRRGFGQRLLRLVLAEELKARCDIEFAPTGLKIDVLAPISPDVFPGFDCHTGSGHLIA